jgi:octaprenyl-diphosphate synthase
MQINEIYQIVERDFEQVNQLISRQLSSEVPLVEKIAHYIVDSGGKRMRPLLVLLTCSALNRKGTDVAKLAAIIEFLHTATLLHDDVVDTSDMRRGKSTANANWGNAPSVLVGDFLYSRAFQMMVDLQNLPIMSVLSNATNVIAEGEVFQLMNCKNPNVSEADYFEVIKNKTAMLFEAASHSAAILANASPQVTLAMKNFGLHLGLAFQLVDDMLDYSGDATVMGKNIGDDLAEGKPTLPLIYTMSHGSRQDNELIRHAIRHGSLERLEQICAAVHRSGGLEYTRQQAQTSYQQAISCLAALEESPSRSALEALAKLAVVRDK